VKSGIIYLDKFRHDETAYIINGSLDYECVTHYNDGISVGGGNHQWVVGVCADRERAFQTVNDIQRWLDSHLSNYFIEHAEDSPIYMGERFACPLDRGMTAFMVDEPLDSSYSFKRPWYTIEESKFID